MTGRSPPGPVGATKIWGGGDHLTNLALHFEVRKGLQKMKVIYTGFSLFGYESLNSRVERDIYWCFLRKQTQGFEKQVNFFGKRRQVLSVKSTQ